MNHELDDFLTINDYETRTPWDNFCLGLIAVFGAIGIILVAGTIAWLVINVPVKP